MVLIFLFLFFIYFVLVTLLILGWRKSLALELQPSSIDHLISVIIPARNEATSIKWIIEDLKKQTYPFFDVLIVDDYSEDQTIEEAQLAIALDHRFTLLKSVVPGKKSSLSKGIDNAKGTIIVTTDADCRIDKDWLKIINDYFYKDDVKLAFGPVRIIDRNSLMHSMQTIEFASLIGSGVATCAYGFPTMCNGANLAFRKDVFEQVGGYHDNLHVPSGDDEFLLRKVFNAFPQGIRFMNRPGAIVSTGAQTSIKRFVNQRIRWAGKWKYHQGFLSKVLSVFVFIFHLATILFPVLVFKGMISVEYLLFVYSIKVFLEFIFLYKVSFFLQNRWHWPAFVLLEVFYPVYVIFIGFLSNFRTFDWKGRTLRSNQVKPG